MPYSLPKLGKNFLGYFFKRGPWRWNFFFMHLFEISRSMTIPRVVFFKEDEHENNFFWRGKIKVSVSAVSPKSAHRNEEWCYVSLEFQKVTCIAMFIEYILGRGSCQRLTYPAPLLLGWVLWLHFPLKRTETQGAFHSFRETISKGAKISS